MLIVPMLWQTSGKFHSNASSHLWSCVVFIMLLYNCIYETELLSYKFTGKKNSLLLHNVTIHDEYYICPGPGEPTTCMFPMHLEFWSDKSQQTMYLQWSVNNNSAITLLRATFGTLVASIIGDLFGTAFVDKTNKRYEDLSTTSLQVLETNSFKKILYGLICVLCYWISMVESSLLF